jgi:hypothetical protein
MPQNQSGWRRGTTADHVLVAAADVGRDRLDNDAVVNFLSARRRQLRIVDALDLDFARPDVNHSVIGSHKYSPSLELRSWNRIPAQFDGVNNAGTKV